MPWFKTPQRKHTKRLFSQTEAGIANDPGRMNFPVGSDSGTDPNTAIAASILILSFFIGERGHYFKNDLRQIHGTV
jgi:hypothetical protein